jgi:hypothetical protein
MDASLLGYASAALRVERTAELRTLGEKGPRFQVPCGMRRLITLASATSTSIRSPPVIRSNRKYRWYLSCGAGTGVHQVKQGVQVQALVRQGGTHAPSGSAAYHQVKPEAQVVHVLSGGRTDMRSCGSMFLHVGISGPAHTSYTARVCERTGGMPAPGRSCTGGCRRGARCCW